MTDKVWLVMGEMGEYSDWSCWPCSVWETREGADAEVLRLDGALVVLREWIGNDQRDYLPGGDVAAIAESLRFPVHTGPFVGSFDGLVPEYDWRFNDDITHSAVEVARGDFGT